MVHGLETMARLNREAEMGPIGPTSEFDDWFDKLEKEAILGELGRLPDPVWLFQVTVEFLRDGKLRTSESLVAAMDAKQAVVGHLNEQFGGDARVRDVQTKCVGTIGTIEVVEEAKAAAEAALRNLLLRECDDGFMGGWSKFGKGG